MTYLPSFTALVLALVVTRVLVSLAPRLGLVDTPNERSLHSHPVATVGDFASSVCRNTRTYDPVVGVDQPLPSYVSEPVHEGGEALDVIDKNDERCRPCFLGHQAATARISGGVGLAVSTDLLHEAIDVLAGRARVQDQRVGDLRLSTSARKSFEQRQLQVR